MTTKGVVRGFYRHELSDVQKDILRGYHGQYSGTVGDYQRAGVMTIGGKKVSTGGYVAQMAMPSLQKTKKTSHACYACNGGGVQKVIFQGYELGGIKGEAPTVTRYCSICGGTGEVFG